MSAPTIGSWVRRPAKGANQSPSGLRVPRWHLVESIVSTDPVTRCGRRLALDADHELEVSAVEPLTRLIDQPQNCKQCGGGQ